MYEITDECGMCTTCVNECPNEAIKEKENGGIFEIDQEKCTECGACVQACPLEAIKEKL